MFPLSLLILRVLVIVSWGSEPKNYDVRLDSLSILPSESYSIAINNLRKMGRQRNINGTVTILEDLDNEHFELTFDTYADSIGNGDYKFVPLTMPRKPICDFLKASIVTYMEQYGYTLIYNVNTDFPFDGSQCPIPKGMYYFKNVSINTDGWPLIMPMGYFKGIGTIFKDNQTVGTINWEYKVESKDGIYKYFS